jgi:hypothetical protein
MTITRKTIPVNEPTQAGQASSINNISRAIELNGLASSLTSLLTGSTEPVVDLLRSLVQSAIQDVIDTEFNQFLGSAPYERTEHRQGYRNGSYQRSLKTRAGTIELETYYRQAGLESATPDFGAC